MQSVDQITSRLNQLRQHGFSIEDKESPRFLFLQLDERKISGIVAAVNCGRSRPQRLDTADKLLTKWGF